MSDDMWVFWYLSAYQKALAFQQELKYYIFFIIFPLFFRIELSSITPRTIEVG